MNTERMLKALIKLAAVCLTAPATLAVASTLYIDFGLWRWVTAGAALVLVEGALLLGWQLLDSQGKTATSGQRGLYAALVVVAYVVLWAVALAHGEGLAGIAFRATLGVLIVYSLAEAGILAGLRVDAAIRRDVTNDRQVRKHQRRLAVAGAIADLNAESSIRDKERQQSTIEATARLDLAHRQTMSTICQTKRPAGRETGARDDTNLAPRARKKAQRLAMLEAAKLANPAITQAELGAVVGLSRSAVGSYLAELETVGAGNGNGNGHQLVNGS